MEGFFITRPSLCYTYQHGYQNTAQYGLFSGVKAGTFVPVKPQKTIVMNKIYKLFIAAFAVFMFGAPTQAQNISYKIVEDDPYNIKKLGIHLDPFWLEMWGHNLLTMGFGTRLDFHVGRLGSLHLDFRRSYFESNAGDVGFQRTNWIPENGFKKYMYIEPQIAINLSDRTRTEDLNVTLSSSSSSYGGYTFTSSTFIPVPGSVRKIVALHGGFYSLTSTYNTELFNENKAGMLKDSMIYATTTINGKDSTVFLPVGTYGNLTTMVLEVGFSFKTIKNLWLNADGYGQRGHTGYTDFYIDFLFAPVIKLSDMKYADVDANVWKVDSDAKRRIGWMVGWASKKPLRSNFSYKYEFGQRPGLKGGAWFFNMIIGYNIALM